jgi:hypothetical protein
MIEGILLKQDSDSWEQIWDKLSNNPLNNDVEDKKVAFNEGESWQLMSVIVKNNDLNNTLVSFRHRCHPLDNERKDITLSCSINEADIEVKKLIK